MENEIMNNGMDVEELVNAEDVIECCEDLVPLGNGKKLIGFGLVAGIAVGAVALIRKNRGKLEQWQIKRLEKKGYVVYKDPVDDESYDHEEQCDCDSTEEI